MPNIVETKISRLKTAADKKLKFWKDHLNSKIVKMEAEHREKDKEIKKVNRKVKELEKIVIHATMENDELKSQLSSTNTQLKNKESQLTETQQILHNFEREKYESKKPVTSNHGCAIAGVLLRILADNTTYGRTFNGRRVLRPGHKLPDRELNDLPITFRNITRDELQLFYDVTGDEFHARLDSLWTAGCFGFGTTTHSLLINNDYVADFTDGECPGENPLDLTFRKKLSGEVVSAYEQIVHFDY